MVYNLNGVVISMDDNIAPQFSESTAYAAGDYVLKLQENGQNILYKFTYAHAAGAWTGTDAQAVTMASELTDVKSQLSDITESNNVLYVTESAKTAQTHYGVTYQRIDAQTAKLYGTPTQSGFLMFFNGLDTYAASGSNTPQKTIPAGTYRFCRSGAETGNVYYTESNLTNRVAINNGDIVAFDSAVAFCLRVTTSQNWGTEENPSYVSFALYENTYLDTVIPPRTAVDPVVRAEIKTILPIASGYNHGPYDIYAQDFSGWYGGQQNDYTAEGFNANTTYADVISAFDALMALDTQYITKTELGSASGTGYKLYEYVFKPKHYISDKNTRKMPKIYMDGSIHGFEKCSTYGLFYFLKDLVAKWDSVPALEAIRNGVEIHVIPVSNPYGFDNNSYKNANSVNINRNFDHPGEWVVVPDGSDQNGLAAFDQPESAIIRDWLLAAESDLMFYANLHTNGQYYTTGPGEMNACMTSGDRNDQYFNRLFRVFTSHIDAQTVRWPAEHNTITLSSAQFCGKIQTSETAESAKGTASAWANTMRKIVSMTLEGFNGYKNAEGEDAAISLFSAGAMKINSENIGNMVSQICREFAE